MKVILSVEPVRYPLTGIGRYTFELARHLQTNTSIEELRFFAGRSFRSELAVPQATPGGSHFVKRFVQKRPLFIETYRVLSQYLKGKALKGMDEYLYHGPNFFLPPFPGPSVVTFHDLSPFTWKSCHQPQLLSFMEKGINYALHTASALITDSEYTRRELANYFSWPLEHIHAVPLASSGEFTPRPKEEVEPLLNKYKLRWQGYSLFVSTIEPRKNIETLLEAYSRLPQTLRLRYPLILTGYEGWQNESIMQRISKAEREGWARYLGFLPSNELPLLFAGARLFTFPSHYEGFGLPVLEAMSSGIPVVCSNSSSLPEVAGEAALMCEPMDVDSLTGLLSRGLEDETWREQAITLGLKRAAEFSWARCAAETVQVYKKVLSAR
ncbi:glycosyltransferase family 1 protein [Pseudomonas sp. LTJR-52]|uniref:glycosyltransferase family 4 protein n=1 Tax=Pseudomonas sp. LTJR-52 TaxID=2479392 RepID=UPI000EFD483C|nr:glycosyltransferase family 1 protein [Pseudomonas sp. LTJR-52]AYN92946.1 glycosyltransferase family 1 protein [Pseudomonas sp. LTJR-52]